MLYSLQNGMLQAVDNTPFSIGYAGLVNVESYKRSTKVHYDSYPRTSCTFRVAKIVNKAGDVVTASQAATQAALGPSALSLLLNSACPGFGLCADISDADDSDVWPIIAVSVTALQTMPLSHSPA